jgi:hypothetical protein
MKLFSQRMLGNLGAKDETRKRYFSYEAATDSELGNKAMEDAGVGDAIGVTAGAILATVAAIGSSAANPRTRRRDRRADCDCARRGGRTGRRDHRLASAGAFPEERAKLYESDLKDSGIVLGVSPCNDDYAVYFEGERKG